MSAPALPNEDLTKEAAQLAAAMLRFQEPLAHLMGGHTPEGMPVVGVDAYAFWPSPRMIAREQVAEYLAALPAPAMLAPTAMRGVIALVLLQEVSDERRAAIQHQLDNQSALLSSIASGADTDRVLLDFDDESHLFSLAAVRRWAQRYGVLVGWSMGRCREPARAEWEIHLLGGDGKRYSKGFGR